VDSRAGNFSLRIKYFYERHLGHIIRPVQGKLVT
jgi:hypothetical protein